jgi:hypothetical protein
MFLEQCTQGEAVVRTDMPFKGVNYVAVGIVGTKKAIATCGLSDSEDREESIANANLIAAVWNVKHFKIDDFLKFIEDYEDFIELEERKG